MSQAPLLFDSGRRNLFIEAGAGTGKTTEIVSRVLRILLDDPNQAAERIVLITFTEKAAGEIAERIRDALIDLRGSFETDSPGWPSGAGTPILAVPPEKREAWKAACDRHLEELDKLRSQTIHSFCQSILVQHPFEASVDPGFRIVEGFERLRILDQIWGEWVRAETATEPAAEIARQWEIAIEALGGLDGVRNVLLELFERRAVAFDDAYPLSRFETVEARAREAVETIRARPASDFAAATDEALVRVLEHLRGDLPIPAGTDAWIAWLAPIAPWLRRVDLPKGKAFAPIKEAFKLLRGADKENNLHDLLAGERAAHAVHAMARRFTAHVEREKDARGILDFDDLLIRTERLLRDPRIAAAVRGRFDFIFVDEFQDTDRLQARIVERLARDEEGTFLRGRVVLVGDPKQSIYSFRRADPETYGAMLELFVEHGADTPRLQHQYRSHPDLVAALNAMFEVLFSRPSEPNVYRPGYTPLIPGLTVEGVGTAGGGPSPVDAEPETDRRSRSLRPRIRMLRAVVGENGDGDEARAIASFIASRIADGAEAKEFAILLRKMTDVDPILEALDRAGIDYVLPRNTPLLDRRAAIDLLALLRAVAAPWDRGAEVSAARGPFFALTDQEIVADHIARASSSEPPAPSGEGVPPASVSSQLDGPASCGAGVPPASVSVQSPSPDTPWSAFRKTMKRWRERARAQSTAQTIEMVLAERRVETTFRLLRHGEEMLRDLDAVREAARAWDRESGGSLALFVDAMLRRREGAEIDQAVLEETAAGVRILTVHASKGLEFGTVILPALGAYTAADALSVFTLETPMRLYVKGRLTSAGALLEVNDGVSPVEVLKARGEAEIDRLFYVAVTRAKNEVVFVIDPAKIVQTSFYKPFFAIFPFDRKAMAPLWTEEPGVRVDEIAIGNARIPVAFERVPALAEAAERRSHLLHPEMEARLDREPASEAGLPASTEETLDRAEIRRRAAGIAQRDAGILLHRFLEVWNGSERDAQPLLAKLAAERGATPAAGALVRRRIESIFTSPAWERIREAELVAAESTLWIPAEGGAAERRIDRLLREDGAWLVLDYKSGRPSPARLDDERAQVAGYCRAIEAVTGEPCRGMLWYIDVDADQVVEV